MNLNKWKIFNWKQNNGNEDLENENFDSRR